MTCVSMTAVHMSVFSALTYNMQKHKMFDYNLLGKGTSASDIRNATYWFTEENKKLFFSVYGKADDELLLLDRICDPVVSLYYAMSRDVFPDWAKEAIDKLEEIPKFIAELGV